MKLPGLLDELVFAAHLEIPDKKFSKNSEFITGIEGRIAITKTLGDLATIRRDDNYDVLNFSTMPMAFVAVFKVTTEGTPDPLCMNVSGLTMEQVNHILYRCDAEERNLWDRGCYGIPEYKTFVYAGIVSLYPSFVLISEKNDLGH